VLVVPVIAARRSQATAGAFATRALLAVAVVLALPLAAGAGGAQPSIVAAGKMSVPRAVHTATALVGGNVLIVGGCSSPGCELHGAPGRLAELYDARDGRFVPTGDLREWRDDLVASRLPDGRVLVAGGWGTGGVLSTTELSAADIFVPGAGAFRAVGAMRVPRGAHSAAHLKDGRVLVVGGLSRGRVVATTEIFDPRTGRFTKGPRMSTPRYKAAALTLRDGRVIVVGGAADADGYRPLATTELFDPARNRFSAGPRLRHARYKINGSTALVAGGNVLVAGGAGQAELLDVRTMRFRPIAGSLGRSREFLTATSLPGDRVLLAGGYDAAIVPTARAWLYR
jgi:hypothetical protein